MEILAIYIDDHFLYDEPIYLNFGGKYIFDFFKENGYLNITKEDNLRYIEGFYNNGISNISAIVGNNGVGKTSLMRVLNQEPKSNSLAIYSSGDKIYIQNATTNKLDFDFDFESITYEESPFPLYYSNVLDYTLQDFYSPISESNHIKDSLVEYYHDNVLRQVFFLYSKGAFLNEKYPELPTYTDVSISINNLRKSQFLDSEFYKKATIGKSITEQLNMLWNSYDYESEEMIHKNEEFLKNFEVFVLSLLVTDDTFTQTNGNGFSIGFEEILQQNNFEDKLKLFLKKRLDNIDGPLFEILEENLGVEINNFDDLIEKIRANKFSQISGGFDYGKIKNHAIQTIIRYSRIFKLYNFINTNNHFFQNPDNLSELTLKVKDEETQEILKELFSLYQDVYETLHYIQFEFRVFNINPVQKMSTGEQAILNFYSSVYDFTFRDKSQFQKKKSYVLLLDEPEHGYHAIWKKKFIWTLNKTIPALFSDLKQKPSVQIIFTTHDALTLSDLPNDKISYLKRLDDNSIKVFHQGDSDRPKKSFGANIHELLADSFFVDEGLIGDFAKEKIETTISWINTNKNHDKRNSNFLEELEMHSKVIFLIDEPVLRFKLSEMIGELRGDVSMEKEMLQKEIDYLTNKRNNL
ncbi:AAA family ATPase [Maribacter aquivivus]|uniref:AAA family ATPase n=1 Tax=Maribacter aquivivus TaxID=228958 RepID=UPI002494B15D|nr:AAA family ATPase [Maribacter aquivivus]